MIKMRGKKDVLVKINKELYEKIRMRVEKDRVNFPSIKNFVEKAAAKIMEADEFVREKIVHNHNHSWENKSGNHNRYKHIPGGVG